MKKKKKKKKKKTRQRPAERTDRVDETMPPTGERRRVAIGRRVAPVSLLGGWLARMKLSSGQRHGRATHGAPVRPSATEKGAVSDFCRPTRHNNNNNNNNVASLGTTITITLRKVNKRAAKTDWSFRLDSFHTWLISLSLSLHRPLFVSSFSSFICRPSPSTSSCSSSSRFGSTTSAWPRQRRGRHLLYQHRSSWTALACHCGQSKPKESSFCFSIDPQTEALAFLFLSAVAPTWKMGLSTYFHVILFVLRRFDWRTQGCLLRFRCLARFFFWWWCAGFAEFHRFLIAVIMFHSLVLIVGVPLAGHTDRRPRCSRRRVPFRRRPLRTKKKVINEKKQKEFARRLRLRSP